MRPMAATARPRTGAGIPAHDSCAALAAAHAAANVAASASWTSATTSVRRDGVGDVTVAARRPPVRATVDDRRKIASHALPLLGGGPPSRWPALAGDGDPGQAPVQCL